MRMDHQWAWEIHNWNTVAINLARLEAEGWIIFAIVPTTDRDVYCRVIMRREKKIA